MPSQHAWRRFRVDRIQSLTLLDAPRQPLTVAQQEAISGLGESAYRPSDEATEVTLRLAPTAGWVADLVPVHEVVAQDDGGQVVRLWVEDTQWVVRFVAQLGGFATVLAPDHVAASVVRSAREALGAYQGDD